MRELEVQTPLAVPDGPAGAPGWWRLAVAGLLVLAVIFGSYRSVLTNVYGYNDDYLHVFNVRLDRFDPAHNDLSGMGRPLSSFALYALFSFADSVDKLVWIRLVSLLGLAALAIALLWIMHRGGLPPGFALTVALLVALSPAGGVCAAWATAVCLPFALLLSLGAGWLIERWLRGRGGSPRPARGLILPVLLLLVSCTIWQAAAPFALLAVLLGNWAELDDDAAAARRVWLALGVFVGSVLLYLLLLRLALRVGLLPRVGFDRLALATDPLDKARFLLGVTRTALTSWGRFQPGWREVAVGVLTGGGCLAALTGFDRGRLSWRHTGRRLLAAAAVTLAGVAPVLVASENNAACRTLVLLYGLVAFLAVAGFSRLLHRWPPGARGGAAAGLVLLAGLAADYHVRWGIVEPNHREYTGLRRLVLEQFSAPPRRVVYLVPPYEVVSRTKLEGYWEYGLLSSPFWWVTKPFLSLLFQEIPLTAATGIAGPERGKFSPRKFDFEIHYWEAGHAGIPVLRPLPVLLENPGVWTSHDPHWGEVQRFPDSWAYVPWLGYLDERRFPTLRHPLLGFLEYIGDGPGNLWFFRTGLGIWHTSPADFPNLFLNDQHRWLRLADEPETRLHLYDPAGPLRIPLGEQARAAAR